MGGHLWSKHEELSFLICVAYRSLHNVEPTRLHCLKKLTVLEWATLLDNMELTDSMANAECNLKFAEMWGDFVRDPVSIQQYFIAYDLTFRHWRMGFNIYQWFETIFYSDAFEFTSLDRNTDDWLGVPVPHVCLLIIIVMTITARRGLGVN